MKIKKFFAKIIYFFQKADIIIHVNDERCGARQIAPVNLQSLSLYAKQLIIFPLII